MAHAHFVELNPAVLLMHVSLGFVRKVRSPDLVVNARPPQFVLHRDAQGMETNLSVLFHPPLVHVLKPKRGKVGRHLERFGRTGRNQFPEHRYQFRVQGLGSFPPALLVKRDLAVVFSAQDNIPHRVQVRLCQPDTVIAGNHVAAPEDRSVGFRLGLDVCLQLSKDGIREINRTLHLVSPYPKLAAGIGGRVTAMHRFLHQHGQGLHFQQRRVVCRRKLAALGVRNLSPLKVLEAMLAGKLARREDSEFNPKQAERSFDRLVTAKAPGVVPVFHGRELGNPRFPSFFLCHSRRIGGLRPLAQRVGGFQFAGFTNILPDIGFKSGAESCPLSVRTVGEVVNATTFHKECHTENPCHSVSHPATKLFTSLHETQLNDKERKRKVVGDELSSSQAPAPTLAKLRGWITTVPSMQNAPFRKHFIERTAHQKGYRVSGDGKTVTSPFRDEPCRPACRKDGYPWFTVCTESGISRRCTVHRLQAYQLFGERIYENGMMVRHLDGDRMNPAAYNLALGTSSDNQLDRPEADRIRCAGLAALKFNHEAVREFYRQTKSYKQTMAEFGLKSKGTLHHILHKPIEIPAPNPIPHEVAA